MRTAVNKLFDDFVKNGGGFVRRLPPPWGIPDISGWEPIVELRDREASDRPSHLYVLIHGTFAADETVVGNRWWQASHAFVDELLKYKAGSEVCAFQWSGRNSELARRTAGARLWLFLSQLEHMSIPYSIVSHSHGGSVVWDAFVHSEAWHTPRRFSERVYLLQDASLFRGPRAAKLAELMDVPAPIGFGVFVPLPRNERYRRFDCLQKWVTVATPFFHAERKSTVIQRTVEWLLLAGVFACQCLVLFSPRMGGEFRLLMLVILTLLGVWLGLRIRERNRVAALVAAEPAAWAVVGNRLASVYSNCDEAINGLKSALDFDAEVVPRATFRTSGDRVPANIRKWFYLDKPSFDFSAKWPEVLFEVGVYWAHRVADWTVSPWVDRYLRARMRVAAFGSDFDGHEVSAVHPWPCGCERSYGSIEETINFNVSAAVSRNAPAVADQGRKMLWQVAVGGIGTIKPEECDQLFQLLVHNEYFSLPEIRSHIRDCLEV